MIQINCTNCKSLLQIDDAFAGGVCRCRHCGTIQTVPKRLRTASTVGVGETSANESPGSKSFTPANKRGLPDPLGATGSGTGLDDLAGIVASSGLTSGRLQKKTPATDPDKTPAPTWDRKIIAIVASAGAVILLLLGIIMFMAFHERAADTGETELAGGNTNNTTPSNPPPPTNDTSRTTTTPPPPQTKLANIFGEPLTETTITYVIDRGDSSGENNRLELTKAALLQSLRTLGGERRFQVVFWTVGNGDVAAFPKVGTALATPENIAKVKTLLDDEIYPHGATDPKAALTRALKSKPDVVVLIPIKAVPVDLTTFAKDIFDLRQSLRKDVKIHCFSLQQPDWSAALDQIAGVTGGVYRDIPLTKLQQYGGL